MVIILLVVIIFFLQLIEIQAKNSLDDLGVNIVDLKIETSNIQKDNDALKQQLLHYQSLEYIDARSRTEGFTDTKTYIYLQRR